MNIVFPLLAITLLFIAFLVIHTLSFRGRSSETQTIPVIDIQKDLIAQHLSEIVQIKSISKVDALEADQQPFIAIKDWIEKTYPFFSTKLDRVVINKYSLLFKWVGTESKLDPVLFNAHMDVVPVDAETLEEWDGDPFSGKISAGYVWGR